MEIIKGGVTAAKGYEAASTAAGIKYTDRTDMAMIYSQAPCAAAGTFTTNVVKAAPVRWDQQVIAGGDSVQAVIVNSGIANACTGTEGFGYCKDTAKAAAEALGISESGVLIGSTGVIGKQIPIDKLTAGIKELAEKKNDTIANGTEAAKAIMTTDTFEKELAVTIEAGGRTVTIGGMAKGSGMIHPNMCTMLAFITTDAVIAKETLQKALSEDIKDTYNMISVDGDTSTNDTVLVMANGLAQNPEITEIGEAYSQFQAALHEVMLYLCRQIAGDGEGATALFEVKVIHAKTKEQAKILSKSVITSNLTKAMIFGHDANCGRILCAMGYAGVSFDPNRTDLYFESVAGKLKIVENGIPTDYSEEKATEILSEKEVTVIADIKEGEESATAWGCDLTYEYVKINGDYRS